MKILKKKVRSLEFENFNTNPACCGIAAMLRRMRGGIEDEASARLSSSNIKSVKRFRHRDQQMWDSRNLLLESKVGGGSVGIRGFVQIKLLKGKGRKTAEDDVRRWMRSVRRRTKGERGRGKEKIPFCFLSCPSKNYLFCT